jgi:hypothetical protein
MLQVIKMVLIDNLKVTEEKCSQFMQYQNKDLDDVLSIPNQINQCDFFEVELDELSALVVTSRGDINLYFELLDKSGVNYTTEDVTSLYFKNQLRSFVPEDGVNKFDQFLNESLSVDDILDKISESGIDSLNDVDKMVLQRA